MFLCVLSGGKLPITAENSSELHTDRRLKKISKSQTFLKQSLFWYTNEFGMINLVEFGRLPNDFEKLIVYLAKKQVN